MWRPVQADPTIRETLFFDSVVICDPTSVQTDLLSESFKSWNLKGRLHQARNVQTFSSRKRETYKAVTLKESLSEGTAQQIDAWSLVVAPRVLNFNMCLDVEASSRKHRARQHYPGKFCGRFLGCLLCFFWSRNMVPVFLKTGLFYICICTSR